MSGGYVHPVEILKGVVSSSSVLHKGFYIQGFLVQIPTDICSVHLLMYFRCFYIAQSYAGAKKWRDAIGLYTRVLHYAQEAIQNYKQLSRGALYKVCMIMNVILLQISMLTYRLVLQLSSYLGLISNPDQITFM